MYFTGKEYTFDITENAPCPTMCIPEEYDMCDGEVLPIFINRYGNVTVAKDPTDLIVCNKTVTGKYSLRNLG